MKATTYFSVAAIALLAVIQLVPVNRSNPPAVGDLDSPAEVKVILEKSCYDCHSNETKWPFYSYVAPVSWMIAREVNEGRKEVNFSEWASLSEGKKQEMKGELLEKVSEGEMPPRLYLALHSEARMDQKQKDTLRSWVGGNGRGHHHKEEGDDD